MSDGSESGASRGETSSSCSSRDYSTNPTIITVSEHSDDRTVIGSVVNGHPPSNPETPSEVSVDETMTEPGEGDVPEGRVNDERYDYGLRIIESRDEPWSPRVTPHASQQDLRARAEEERKEVTVNHEDEKDDGKEDKS